MVWSFTQPKRAVGSGGWRGGRGWGLGWDVDKIWNIGGGLHITGGLGTLCQLSSSQGANDINLKNHTYSYEYCPPESSAGGTLLHIRNYLSHKPRNGLCIYKTTESIKTKKPHVIICGIYRDPNMDLDEFNEIYHNPLLHKISKESKSIFLLGKFNVDLLKYDHHAPTNEFFNSFSSHMFLPHIQSTRVTSSSKTLIDNIFYNILGPDFVSGNLTATVSDHLP